MAVYRPTWAPAIGALAPFDDQRALNAVLVHFYRVHWHTPIAGEALPRVGDGASSRVSVPASVGMTFTASTDVPTWVASVKVKKAPTKTGRLRSPADTTSIRVVLLPHRVVDRHCDTSFAAASADPSERPLVFHCTSAKDAAAKEAVLRAHHAWFLSRSDQARVLELVNELALRGSR